MPNSFGNLQAEDAVPGDMTDLDIQGEILRCGEFLAEIDNEQRYAHQFPAKYGGRIVRLANRKASLQAELTSRLRVGDIILTSHLAVVGYAQALIDVNIILGAAVTDDTTPDQLDLLTDLLTAVGNLKPKVEG